MNEIKISILCPTAKRPTELKNMVNSALNLAAEPNSIEFCLYVNIDDESYDEFILNFPTTKFNVIRGPKMWLSTMYNCLLVNASGELYMWGGDDVVFLTQNWDQKILEKFSSLKDPIGMVFVNDLTDGSGTWANVGFIHRKWVEFFGFLFTPHMPDNGIDAWITSITKKLNRAHFLQDVVIEHRQYRQGKSNLDDTYLQRLQQHKIYNPLFLYKLLDEEKRRDLLMLSVKLDNKFIPFDYKFAFSYVFLKTLKFLKIFPMTDERLIYLGSMSNISLFKLLLRKLGIPIGPKTWY